MELKLNLLVKNLYGGDGNIRYIEEKQVKFSRTKSKKTKKMNIDVSTENLTGEESSEMVKREIQTFKMNNGKPTYRFGGIHGKMWGHLRASGKMLADLGVEGFDSKAFIDRIMMSVNITPIELTIENHKPIEVAEIPQITAGISKALIIQKFDYIPECKVQMTLQFPEMYLERVLKILKQAESLAGMNKRRAEIKVLNRKEVFGKEEQDNTN